MAYEMQIPNSEGSVKIRSLWAVALLPIVTLGIYHLVWWYKINRELRDFGQARGYDLGQSPTNSVLALFPGALILIPPLVSYWRGTKRVQGAMRLVGKEAPSGWIALILYFLLAPGFWAYLQNSLNDLWRTEAQALPGQAAPPEPAGQMPQPLEGGAQDTESAKAPPSPPSPGA